MLRQKESDLEKTESLLNSFQYEVQLLSQERKRLIGLQNNLELELETSAQAHKQLAEQKTENEMLKEIIDTLKTDLDEALQQQQESTSAMIFLDAVEEHIENEAEAAKEDESSHAIVPSSTTTLKVFNPHMKIVCNNDI
jgi:polyribonucleotide nucleotidyltransferase